MLTPADLILGPPGVLPPDPVGARVFCSGGQRRGVIFDAPPGYATVGVRHEGGTEEAEDRVGVALDLSPPHSLDHAARALWHLLDLGEQPLTAPGWVWDSLRGCWWFDFNWYAQPGNVKMGATFYRDGARGMVIPGLPGKGEDRRALALTLAVVAESRR